MCLPWPSSSRREGYTVNTYPYRLLRDQSLNFDTPRICVGLNSAVFETCGLRSSVDVFYNLRSDVHCMQTVICSLQSASYSLQSAFCILQSAVCKCQTRLTEIVFIVQRLTGELNGTNVKQFEIDVFFHTSIFVKYLSNSLVRSLDFLRLVCRRYGSQFNDKAA